MQRLYVMALLALALPFVGCCGTVDDDYLLPGYRTYYTQDGKLFALGARSRFENVDFFVAEREGKPLPRWREFLRIGEWEFRYPDGQRKAVINYEVEWYTQCCTGGPCEQPYEIRVGSFEAWWPTGARLAAGRFDSVWESINTSCGGDRLKRAVIADDAQFWDEAGVPTDRSILVTAGVPLEDL